MKKMYRPPPLHKPGKMTRLLLQIELPIILIASVALFISYLCDRAIDPILANLYYPPQLEYIFASLTVVSGSCLISEICTVEQEIKNSK